MTRIHRKHTLPKLRSQIGWKVAFLRPPGHLKSLFFTDFRDFKLQYLREHTFYYSLSMSDTWRNIQGTSWYDRNDLSTPTAKVIWKNTFFLPVHLKWPLRTQKVKGARKSIKSAIDQPKWIFLSKFSCSMFTANKTHVFSFFENRKNQFEAFTTENPIHFFKFPGLSY